MYQKINHYIETLKEKYVQIWIDVCNLESPTHDKAGVDRVGQYFAQRGKELGFLVEVYPQAVAGDVITLTMNPEAKGGVAMSGHIDTVHPVGLFGSPAVRVEGDRIYGPGTLDCKGGVVGALMAMEALSLAGCKDRVMLLLQTDEEVGSSISGRATIHYICEKAKDCKAFFNCEGHRDGNGVTLYRKGILRYRFEVIGQAFHASRCFAGGKSAILEASHKIIELEKQKDGEGITFSCGTIGGGTAENTVPERCTFSLDIRYATAEQEQQAHEIVKRVAETSYTGGTTCEYTLVSTRPAMEKVDRNYALLDKLNAIYAKNNMPLLKGGGATGGSDAAYVTLAGIPCVDSVGAEGAFLHTISEYGILSSLPRCALRLAIGTYGLLHES